MKIAQQTKNLLRPPYGLQVRKVAVGVCAAVSIPRIFDPGGTSFIIPRFTVGIWFAIVGILLALTLTRRLTVVGRVVSAFAFTTFVTLAFDSFGASLVSALVSIVIALSLFGEATAND